MLFALGIGEYLGAIVNINIVVSGYVYICYFYSELLGAFYCYFLVVFVIGDCCVC